ncbi:MAG: NYN domain-containing protein [Oscillospiraceae bacterium]
MREKLGLARGGLMDMLSNHCGFTMRTGAGVLAAPHPRQPQFARGVPQYTRRFHQGRRDADAYIERFAYNIGKNYDVRVVTIDNLIRLSALRSGVCAPRRTSLRWRCGTCWSR